MCVFMRNARKNPFFLNRLLRTVFYELNLLLLLYLVEIEWIIFSKLVIN